MKRKIDKLIIFLIVSLVVLSAGSSIIGVFAQQPYTFPTTTTTPFYVQYGRIDGAFFNVPNVISNGAANRTLLSSESGSTVTVTAGSAVDTSGTATISLPAPTAGLVYEVSFGTSLTAGTLKVKTDAGTTLIAGGVTVNSTGGTGAINASCNGTTHLSISMNGTTTGGQIGSWIRFKALTTTLWNVSGILTGSGVAATPCSTS